MAHTYFHEFNLDDGRPITVEFSYSPGSETTYSPMNGAEGGDGCVVEIIDYWPATRFFGELSRNRSELEWTHWSPLARPFAWMGLQIVKFEMWLSKRDMRPSNAEFERMEAWLVEHHVFDPSEPEEF